MTRDELERRLAADVTQPLKVALEMIGLGETAGRAALKRGELPFRVIRVSRKLRAVSVDLEDLLLRPGGRTG